MPPAVLIPIVIGGLTVGGLTLAGYTLGAALLYGAITTGLSIASNFLAPRPQVGAGRAAAKSMVRSAVSPARYILGRARVSGVLAHAEVDDRTLHLVLALAEGACQEIERIWIDETEITFSATTIAEAGGGRLLVPSAGEYVGGFTCREYFAGDGSQGAASQSLMDGWGSGHKLNFISWVHLEFKQNEYGRDLDERLYDRVPNVHFLVRGAKLTWPGQTTALWTDNAAAIRYWWDTTRRRRPASVIDTPAFTAALTLCGQTVTIQVPNTHTGLSGTYGRYRINGLIFADADPAAVEQQMDAAWQGHAVEFGGKLYYAPGQEQIVQTNVPDDAILEWGELTPAPPLQERINALTVRIAQSKEHDWLEFAVPEITDGAKIARDSRLARDLGQWELIAEPVAAARNLAVQLRRARGGLTVSLRVTPGESFEYLGLLPGQVITLTAPTWGWSAKQFQILGLALQEDWSIWLTLQEWASGIYADTLTLPPLGSLFTRRVSVAAPRNVAASTESSLEPDGTLIVALVISWTVAAVRSTQVRTRVKVASGTANAWETHLTFSSRLSLVPVTIGTTYEYQVRHVGAGGKKTGDWSALAEITIGGDLTAPETPTGLTVTALPNGYIAGWDAAVASDYAYTILQHRPTPAQGETAQAWTETTRTAGTHFTVLNVGSTTGFDVQARHVDRSGNGSAWCSLVSVTTEAAATAGIGIEPVFAAYSADTIPVSKRPSNAWTYGAGGTADRLAWSPAPVATSSTNPYHFTAVRITIGQPSSGDAVSDEWSSPAVIGHYGEDGDDGDDAQGLGYEPIFAAYSAATVPNSKLPSNSWGYKAGGTSDSLVWATAPVSTSTANPYLLTSVRVTIGQPAAGDAVSDTWSTPAVLSKQGDPAVSHETIYAVYSAATIPSSKRPNNSWGYKAGGTSDSLAWSTTLPSETAATPYLFASARSFTGTPAAGAAITDTWSTPAVIGHFGADGINGTNGTPGADAVGRESVYTTYSAATLPARKRPSNSWGYNAGGTIDSQVWATTPVAPTAGKPYPLVSTRITIGQPSDGDAVSDNWSTPVAYALRGATGQQGGKGDKGDKGDRGDPAARSPVFVYVRVSQTIANSIANLSPSDALPTAAAAAASGAVPNDTPLTSDSVILYRDNVSIQRTWDGSRWIGVSRFFPGSVLVYGTLVAEHVASVNLSAVRGNFGELQITGTLSAGSISSDVQNARVLWQASGVGQFLDGNPTVDFTLAEAWANFDTLIFTAVATGEGAGVTVSVPVSKIPSSESGYVEWDGSGGRNLGKVAWFQGWGGHGTGQGLSLRCWGAGGTSKVLTCRGIDENEGVISSIVGIKQPAPAGAPEGTPAVTASSGNTEVVLQWTGVVSATHYQYRRKSTTSSTWGAWSSQQTATSKTVTGLSNGTSYDFQVRARNSAGTGPSSSTVSATPATTVAAPVAPTGVTATAGDAQVSLSWDSVTGASAYQYRRKAGSGSWGSWSADHSGTSETVTGLSNGTTYSFQVRAKNSAGTGPASSTVTATPTASVTAPTGSPTVTATAGNAQVSLSWTSVTGATHYQYRRKATTSSTWGGWSSQQSGTTATVTGLTNGTQYNFQARARNSAGTGPASSTVNATPRSPVSAPTGSPTLGATARDSKVLLAWSSVSSATHYQLRYKASTANSWFSWGSQTTATSANVTGLTNGTQYNFQVRARNSAGPGPASPTVNATPTRSANSPTSAPTLTVVGRDKHFDISCTSVSGATSYEVRSKFTRESRWSGWSRMASGRIDIEFISGNGSSVDFQARARNRHGTGPVSAIVAATAQATAGAPSDKPPVTAVAGTGRGRISASWTAVSGATHYQYGHLSQTHNIWSGWSSPQSGLTANITGLSYGRVALNVCVRAINASGVGPVGSSAPVTPH